ncbi:hypothetical protein SERLA73DRAFT_99084 [Serpula lacrymans var. lacrymans S7.3]|uniref:GRIP domain-containing protein n=2 Tax=Serpula lacrymans var. lacrymans TaxID=341189 RepID=F8QGK8_SERL3|nr:uncharacterized protein SERLADRAFT_353979 [Serpula lacrymans var. lacrymans S7.9]EGN92554.1 hypothetical protein SERLA73DRAFT_99084 [Serpula lacrymans var. lacrymans S7.3]EGO29300.1 hypothetical protein SERLADRAFT_353979 [Serpula lacrymans var. lacrymans S7.9]
MSLLKAVRQKLIKAEKDRDDAFKELNGAKERERKQKEQDDAERAKLQSEVNSAKAERESAVAALRAQFDKELADTKIRLERDLSNVKEQLSLDMTSMKESHFKELAFKNSRLSSLEASVNSLSAEKNSLFDQLMIRQAELESSQCHSETLQSQNTELEFQLRECRNNISLLNEEILDVRGDQSIRSQTSLTSSEELVQSLAAAEAKYEAKISHLRKSLEAVEKERNENEAEWSRKLREKIQEAEEFDRMLQSSAGAREKEIEAVEEVKAEVTRLNIELKSQQEQCSVLRQQMEHLKNTEALASQRTRDVEAQRGSLEKLLDESKARENHMLSQNKTLREELHKIQTSLSLLERRRSPGVGYWSPRQGKTPVDSRTSTSSLSDPTDRVASPDQTSSPKQTKSDEEVNFEYLRNVIMQFLEHKEMRPNLVRVLSVILHFTPQETRRIVAKV